jgi:predicted ATPase
VIASVQFKHFKALRATSLRLGPFNLVVGPNGSGKTSLIQAFLKLRTLAQQPAAADAPPPTPAKNGNTPADHRPNRLPEIVFCFTPPHDDLEVHLSGRTVYSCDSLQVRRPATEAGRHRWEALRTGLGGIRFFLFDHYAMGEPVALTEGIELASNGRNLAAVLAGMRERQPEVFARLRAEFCRALPDFAGIEPQPAGAGRVELALRLAGENALITTESTSQGALYTLAILTLSFSPRPPTLLCLEETDRGVHPRLLREVRDALYRLSYPASVGEKREAVQIVATTHSPYLLDLFREHPEEIVIANKRGPSATFERLSDRPDVKEILSEGSLGDIWFSGILGGVPEE